MPKDLSDNFGRMTVQLGVDAKNALEEIANRRNAEGSKTTLASDLVREAVQNLLRAEGFDSIAVEVKRGGYREKGK